MIEIHPITEKMILEGRDKWTPPWSDVCCMFGIRNRKYLSEMWIEIFDEVGGIGLISWDSNEAVGQMVFLPKKYARRIGLSTCKTNELMDKTMVIGCLYVPKEHRNRGIATSMTRGLITFCNNHEYSRIEVPVDLRPPDKKMFSTISFFPFRKFGFVIDENSSGRESRPETRMAFFSL